MREGESVRWLDKWTCALGAQVFEVDGWACDVGEWVCELGESVNE